MAFAQNLHITPHEALHKYSYTNLLLYSRHLVAEEEQEEQEEKEDLMDILTT